MALEMDAALVYEPALPEILEDLARLEFHIHQPNEDMPRADVERTIAPDFWEIGASGGRYSREVVMKELLRRRLHRRRSPWTFSDHHCSRLAKDVYLLTYTLVQDSGRLTRRSTIWERFPDGWKMIFHQGTVVQKP